MGRAPRGAINPPIKSEEWVAKAYLVKVGLAQLNVKPQENCHQQHGQLHCSWVYQDGLHMKVDLTCQRTRVSAEIRGFIGPL